MILLIIVLPVIFFCIYLMIDYRGPKYIKLKSFELYGVQCKTAKELIVQEYDRDGNLWASRGMVLYRLKEGDTRFCRVAHVPSGSSFYWLYNFSIFRNFVNKPECVLVTVSGDNNLCAMSAGYIWHSQISNIDFTKTFELRHFGLGVGRGIFSNGINSVNDRQIYFGEYFRNSAKSDVRIFVSDDNGINWRVAYEFPAGRVRHIHSVQKDPFTGHLWVCCGDADGESLIASSQDDFKSIKEIGGGSQMWRTCQLVFTEDKIYWGGDTGSPDHSGVFCWNKNKETVSTICKIKGAILYGTLLNEGTVVFTTDREGFPNEEDQFTRLVIINPEGEFSTVKIGTWKHSKRGYRYSFAMLRTQRTQNNNSLCFSIINQREFSMGKLLIFEVSNLNKLANLSKRLKQT
ncbi:exo-alpha-sialidase [Labilibacter sediminis]|nr:exo-alpha-sialidase [Labilibacter sediminis]